MTAVIRAGIRAGEGQSSPEWRNHFYPGSNQLKLPRDGWFWQAVTTANEDEDRYGKGQVIAVIDSGFDQKILYPYNDVIRSSVEFPIAASRVDAFDGHGTVVAMLAHAVAPAAEILLVDVGSYDGCFRAEHVAAGIQAAIAEGATILNLSIEFSSEAQPARPAAHIKATGSDMCALLDHWFTAVEPYDHARCPHYCLVCSALELVPDQVTIIAATGQTFHATCPAVSRRAVGASFERSKQVKEGNQLVWTHSPGSTDSILLRGEAAVSEPPGFVGTSFASPLIAGFAALVGDPVAFSAVAGFPKALTPLLQLQSAVKTALNEKAAASALSFEEAAAFYRHYHPQIRAGVEHAKARLPAGHNHWDPDVGASPCGLCELFVRDLYLVDATDLIEAQYLHQGLAAAELAARVCPRSPGVRGNFKAVRERLGLCTAMVYG